MITLSAQELAGIHFGGGIQVQQQIRPSHGRQNSGVEFKKKAAMFIVDGLELSKWYKYDNHVKESSVTQSRQSEGDFLSSTQSLCQSSFLGRGIT